MLQNLQNDAKFQNFQLDNLVDFEKCCKTRIYLQRSVPLQPKGFVVTKWHQAAASPRPILTVTLNDGHHAESRDSG